MSQNIRPRYLIVTSNFVLCSFLLSEMKNKEKYSEKHLQTVWL